MYFVFLSQNTAGRKTRIRSNCGFPRRRWRRARQREISCSARRRQRNTRQDERKETLWIQFDRIRSNLQLRRRCCFQWPIRSDGLERSPSSDQWCHQRSEGTHRGKENLRKRGRNPKEAFRWKKRRFFLLFSSRSGDAQHKSNAGSQHVFARYIYVVQKFDSLLLQQWSVPLITICVVKLRYCCSP